MSKTKGFIVWCLSTAFILTMLLLLKKFTSCLCISQFVVPTFVALIFVRFTNIIIVCLKHYVIQCLRFIINVDFANCSTNWVGVMELHNAIIVQCQFWNDELGVLYFEGLNFKFCNGDVEIWKLSSLNIAICHAISILNNKYQSNFQKPNIALSLCLSGVSCWTFKV